MSTTWVQRPASGEYAQFYHGYVSAVPDGDLLESLARQGEDTAALLSAVDEERSRFRYAPGKWSIREVAGHMADAERVFTYRALTFARGDTVQLPSFEETAWARVSSADRRALAAHVHELRAVRAATLALFRGFTDVEVGRTGTASSNLVSVRALAWITAGHERHHVKILRERYGI